MKECLYIPEVKDIRVKENDIDFRTALNREIVEEAGTGADIEKWFEIERIWISVKSMEIKEQTKKMKEMINGYKLTYLIMSANNIGLFNILEDKGKAYTHNEIQDLIKKSEFKEIERVDEIPGPATLYIAKK